MMMEIRAVYPLLLIAGMASALDPSTFSNGMEGGTTYLDWLQQVSYQHSSFVPSTNDVQNGVALHWTTDDTHIHLAVAARATGWAAFGLAESGSMLGADVIMFTAETNELVDSYVLDQPVKPMQDDCQSWTLSNSTVEGDFIIFEASRLLDTEDSQDRAIMNDSDLLIPPTRVIAAWGDTSEPSFHGNNRARSSIRFFRSKSSEDELEAFAVAMAAEAEGNFTVQASDFLIPAVQTTYQYFCVSGADLAAMNVTLDQDLHTIGIEPMVDPRARSYVHHFIVYGSTEQWDSTLDCEDEFPGFELGYVWAPGDQPLNLPPNVGGPLGATGFKSFQIEIHYNNPEADQGILDSSGIRVYYTSKKRQYDLGVYQTGDPFVTLEGEQVSKSGGLAQHVFDCGGGCSESYVGEPVTVIREHLHMHKTGVSMVNAQIRGGEVVRQGSVDFWDFNQQGNMAVVQAPFELQAGDAFRTVCNFDANTGEEWGLGSENEMCIAFLYYFPRQLPGGMPYICGVANEFIDFLLPGCEVSHVETADFGSVAQLERSFGASPSTCPGVSVPPSQDTSSAFSVLGVVPYFILAAFLVVV